MAPALVMLPCVWLVGVRESDKRESLPTQEVMLVVPYATLTAPLVTESPVETVMPPRMEAVALGRLYPAGFVPPVTLPFASTVTDVYVPAVAPLAASVVANEPVPVPVTSPVSVTVWSPVLLPLDVPLCVPENVPD